jgi:hypothetical protein
MARSIYCKTWVGAVPGFARQENCQAIGDHRAFCDPNIIITNMTAV